MGKLVVSEFISVDGVIEDPGGAESFDRGGWAFKFDQGDEGQRFKFDELMAAESLLLGRITYEGFALGPARGPGGDVLVNGSAELVQALVENDLVDEYRLMVFPIVLHVRGEGQGPEARRAV